MTQEEKQLLFIDLCARLPYGVKVQVTNWDSDHDCDFNTVETVVGIDDRFIYTVWDKTGDKDKHSITEPLSVLDYKPYLRPMSSSMTEEEFKEYHSMLIDVDNSGLMNQGLITKIVDWLDEKMFDHRNLIPKGLALKTKEGMYKTE